MSTSNGVNEISVTGTLVWYYYICKREVWLMSHNITPAQDNENIELGKFIHENSYKREKKEISIGNMKLDIIKRGNTGWIVGEIKKSSKFEASSKMQLLFYLSELEKAGLNAVGELKIPQEREVIRIELEDDSRQELEFVKRDILRIVYTEKPDPPKKIMYCRNCAFSEFCWS